jgi:hypothetical protein
MTVASAIRIDGPMMPALLARLGGDALGPSRFVLQLRFYCD